MEIKFWSSMYSKLCSLENVGCDAMRLGGGQEILQCMTTRWEWVLDMLLSGFG